jgi:C4-dicarboxylate-specific signal transduction histidine kinase
MDPADRKLKPDTIGLPAAEIHHLYRTLARVLGTLHHDLLGDVASLTANQTFASKALSLIEEKYADVRENPLFADLKASLADAEAIATGFMRRVHTLLRGDGAGEDPLVSVPHEIASRAITGLGATTARISESSSRALEILFPQVILNGLVQELLRNALRASGGAEIRISWRQENNVFVLKVEDAGPGFSGVEKGAQVLILELGLERISGLRIWAGLVRGVGGMLLAARSESLGGAQVTARLPVYAFYDESQEGHGRVHTTVDQ